MMVFFSKYKSLPLVIFMVFVFNVASCSSSTGGAETIRQAETSNTTRNKGWQVKEDKIYFSGVITDGTYDIFQKIITNKTRYIVVNSGGGSVYDAAKIGQTIQGKNMTIIVRGVCLSSCANFLLPAANKVVLDNGFIGFHGNLASCIHLYGGIDSYLKKDLPVEYSIPYYEKIKKDVLSALMEESKFYSLLSISPYGLISSCKPDKGQNDGVIYDFYAPSSEKLVNFGIKNVIGEQSKYMIYSYETYHQSHVLKN